MSGEKGAKFIFSFFCTERERKIKTSLCRRQREVFV